MATFLISGSNISGSCCFRPCSFVPDTCCSGFNIPTPLFLTVTGAVSGCTQYDGTWQLTAINNIQPWMGEINPFAIFSFSCQVINIGCFGMTLTGSCYYVNSGRSSGTYQNAIGSNVSYTWSSGGCNCGTVQWKFDAPDGSVWTITE